MTRDAAYTRFESDRSERPLRRSIASPTARWLVRQVPAIIGGVALAVAAVLGWMLFTSQSAAIGHDWYWYADGAGRLLDSRPLYDPLVTSGPYDSYDAEHLYVFAPLPPYLAVLAVPFLALPGDVQTIAWTIGNAAAIAAAVWLTFPRRAPGLGLLIVGAGAIVGLGLVQALFSANHNGWVALGVALALTSRRPALVGLGLLLAGTKVIPAIALGAWLLARGDWRALVWAAALVAAATLPAIVLEGPAVLLDSFLSMFFAIRVDLHNISPVQALGLPTSAGILAAAAIILTVLWWRRDVTAGAVVVVASMLAIPNLWVHWLIVPMVAALAIVRERTTPSA